MRNRPSFTLIELLVTITIVIILASMVLFAVNQAQVSARRARTQATITKLHTLVSQQLATYRTRRVPIAASGLQPADAAELSYKAKLLLMRMEMPNRWSEVENVWSGSDWNSTAVTVNAIPYQITPPTSARGYYRYFSQNSPDDTYQEAECLFMIVTLGLPVEDEASRNFSDNEIGDVDGDGANEFLDGWGTPISFARWPVGYLNYATIPEFGHLSDLQPPRLTVAPCLPDATEHHNSLDPRGTNPIAFVTFPLIYSAGPDKLYDIFPGGANEVIDDPFAAFEAPADPCAAYDPLSDTPEYVGIPADRDNLGGGGNGSMNHQDNIHNHLLEGSIQ